MNAIETIPGIHHITAVASSAATNRAFYETFLGLRMVKQTVNFDDPFTYHLYYGDRQGAPGTILTFFPWEHLPRGKIGAGMITAVAFAIPRPSVAFWAKRLRTAGLAVQQRERFGDPVITFADGDGLPLELIGLSDPPAAAAWEGAALPEEHALRGFHSATVTLHEMEAIERLLLEEMGFHRHLVSGRRHRFRMAERQAPGHAIDVVADPAAPPGRPGSGTVHHIAFRTPSDRAQLRWQARLRKAGHQVTGVRDRNYFRSIYFHAPGGVLFEMATDPPGFAVDEPLAQLGTALKLPEQYEPMRAAIERRLPPLPSPGIHRAVDADPRRPDDRQPLQP